MMEKLARNEECWCGSGKKYKYCHLEKDQLLIEYELEGYLIPNKALIKTKSQIDGIKKSGKATKYILDTLEKKIDKGMTTNEINEIVYELTIKSGGKPAPLDYHGFPKSVCTSVNDVVCHGIPNDKPLVESDIVNVDITTIINGYFADASRMYAIGNISVEAEQLIKVSKECMEIGIKAIEPYKPINLQGIAIENYAVMRGYSVVKDYGGHGTGLAFHEEPHVHHFDMDEKGMIAVPGMVFTIEPMINTGSHYSKLLEDGWTVKTLDGSLSAQWEHTILVTENGVDILT